MDGASSTAPASCTAGRRAAEGAARRTSPKLDFLDCGCTGCGGSASFRYADNSAAVFLSDAAFNGCAVGVVGCELIAGEVAAEADTRMGAELKVAAPFPLLLPLGAADELFAVGCTAAELLGASAVIAACDDALGDCRTYQVVPTARSRNPAAAAAIRITLLFFAGRHSLAEISEISARSGIASEDGAAGGCSEFAGADRSCTSYSTPSSES